MNARERAIKIAETSGQAGDLVSFKTQAMIEKAIIAAEEAATRKAKEIRESMSAQERGKFVAQMIHNDQSKTPLSLDELESHLILALNAAEEARAKEEREGCADIAKQIKEKELRRLDLETCCSNTAAEIEECIRARSEGEKKENQT